MEKEPFDLLYEDVVGGYVEIGFPLEETALYRHFARKTDLTKRLSEQYHLPPYQVTHFLRTAAVISGLCHILNIDADNAWLK